MTDNQSIAGIETRPGISIPYKTIFEQFEAAAQRAPANAFLCYPATASRDYYPEGLQQSYGDAYAIVMDLADRYRAAGYGIGHRIALVAGNRPEHFWHLFALNSLGACVVTLNQDYLPHEMAYGISFPDCAAVLTAPPWLSKVQDVVSAFDHPIPVIDISALPNPLLVIKSRALLDLHAGVEAADGRWGVRLWGRNVTNTYYWTSAVQNQDVNIRFAGRPATYGVSVSAKF
ncbi:MULTISPECIES: AMP-binding protein [unclassified Sphingobium]|uniref:AMP-binding protein n=1 Tax=unclassified Sphingobium TaxID=2611147 RepID=UPI0035A5C511